MADMSIHATDHAQELLQRRINTLRSKITAWYAVQQLYMPAASTTRARMAQSAQEGSPLPQPYAMPLILPSALNVRAQCDARLQEYEYQLRLAQAEDALDEVRDCLRLRSHLFYFKDNFTRGIRYNTKSRAVINKLEDRITAGATRYNTARTALLKLTKLQNKSPAALKKFQVLAKEDLRGMAAAALGDSEGNRTLSWIWTVHGIAAKSGSVELHDCEFSQVNASRSMHSL
jgi:hypothetical protein